MSNQPRRLLVHLTSELNAQDLLTSDRAVLKNNPDKHIASTVYFNPDLTPTEACLAFEKRQKKRSARTYRQTKSGVTTETEASARNTDTDKEHPVKQVLEQAHNLDTDTTSSRRNENETGNNTRSGAGNLDTDNETFFRHIAGQTNEGLEE